MLGDRAPADVLAAMESIAGGLLLGTRPADGGAEVLAAIGLSGRHGGGVTHGPRR